MRDDLFGPVAILHGTQHEYFVNRPVGSPEGPWFVMPYRKLPGTFGLTPRGPSKPFATREEAIAEAKRLANEEKVLALLKGQSPT